MAQAARRLTIGKKLGFALVVLAFALVALELVLRVMGLHPLPVVPRGTPSVQAYFWVADRALGFRNRPNGRYVFREMAGRPTITTDANGFRNGLLPSTTPSAPAVLFVGDSTTFCAEVNDDQTIPAEVAKKLARKEPVRVLNAGCRGYNTLQSKRMLEECLDRFPGLKVAVYVYCWNDLAGNLAADDEGNFRPTLKRSAAPGGWAEVEPPPFVPPNELPGTRTRLTNRLRSGSALVHHSLYGLRRLEDLARGAAPEAPVLESQPAPRADHALRESESALVLLLEQMDAACRKRGVAFLVAAFTWGPFDPPSIAACCTQAGVPFVSVKDQFTAHDPRVYFALRADGRYDAHYGVRGTQAFAAGVAPAIGAALERAPRVQTAPAGTPISADPGRGH